MSLASVTIAHVAFSDPKVAFLAQLAGYADPEHALGKLAKLWGRCTFLGTDRPDVIEIRACLGRANGEEHLIACGLAERLEDGTIRVKGRVADNGADRFAWFQPPAQQAAAGRARVDGAPRDAKGRLMKRAQRSPAVTSENASAGPASWSSAGPAPSSALVNRWTAGPASGSGSDLPEDPLSPEPEEISPEDEIALPEHQPLRDVTRSPDASLERELEDSQRALAARQDLAKRTWARLDQLRQDFAKRHGVDLRPLHPMDPGNRALSMRIREADSVERAVADLDHVLAVYLAEAEASTPPTAQWLTGAMFEERSYRRALGMSVADASKPRASPRGRGNEHRPEEPVRRINRL